MRGETVKRVLSNLKYYKKETVLGLNILESNVDFDKEDLTKQEKERSLQCLTRLALLLEKIVRPNQI